MDGLTRSITQGAILLQGIFADFYKIVRIIVLEKSKYLVHIKFVENEVKILQNRKREFSASHFDQ